jgi:Fic family protein
LTETELKIYALIVAGDAVTTVEISETASIPERTARRAISKLVEEGYIQRSGGRKQGKWIPIFGTK